MVSSLSHENSEFLTYLRSLSILVIVFGHIGLFWAFKPYSEFLHVFIPVFFFISGVVNYSSYSRSDNLFGYYKKKIIRLLVPLYMLCLVQLGSYLWVHKGWCGLSFIDFIRWVLIIPPNEMMPFSIGHVWFLHTLFVIILLSPLFFWAFNYKRNVYYLIIAASLLISFLQFFTDLSSGMMLFHNDFFKPIVHSSFFLFGILFFYTNFNQKILNTVFLFFLSMAVSIGLAYGFSLNIDYDFHTFAPDLYYVSGSLAAIAFFLFFRHNLINSIKFFRLKKIFKFLDSHIYSIYLVHVPVIALWFNFFAPGGSEDKSIKYGLLKMLFVLSGTLIFSIPFTYFASFVISRVEVFFRKR